MMMGMRRHLLGVVLLAALSLLGATLGYGQSERVKIELKIIKVKAYDEAVRKGIGGNEVRFDVWLENEDGHKSAEVLNELNGVKRSDLPKEIPASGSTAIYTDYGKSVEVWIEGWEEDNCGENDEYDNNFFCKDDRRCAQGFNIVYANQQPGTWYAMDNLKCANKHEVWIEYRWNFSVLPEPVPQNVNVDICLNEDTLQFIAKNNYPHSAYVKSYEWNISKKTLVPVDSTAAQCKTAHGFETEKYYKCLFESGPYYEEDYVDVDNKTTTENQLKYATDASALWVRYREFYTNGEKSPWSERVEKKHTFYKTVTPTTLNVSADGSEIVTNLYCGTSTLDLEVEHPAANGSWEDYNFKWYRKIGEGNSTIITGETKHTITDEGFSTHPGQKLEYTVEVYQKNCTLPLSTLVSGQLYFFEDVPDLSNLIDPANDIKGASCSDRRDGEIIIRATSTNPNLRYYYNIGRIDAAGALQSTEIYSSKRKAANVDFPFKNLLPGDYLVQILHGGYEGLETTGYALEAKNGLPSAGYCFDEHTVTVPYLLSLSLASPTADAVTCHGGNDGKIKVKIDNAVGTPTVINLKRDGADATGYVTSFNGSTLTIDGLLAGDYTYIIGDSRGCIPPPTGNAVVLEPDALDFTTAVSNYNESDISCHGADDAFIEVTATGGNWTNAYSATLTESGQFVKKVDAFTGTTIFTNLLPGSYSVTVEIVGACEFSKASATPITIEEPALLTIDSTETRPITCYRVANGEITVTSQGGTGDRQFRVDGGDWQAAVNKGDEDQIVGLDSGWHTVEVMDINGCVAPSPLTFRLMYPTPLAAQLVDSVMPLCHGSSDGQLFICPSGGNPITQSYQISIRSIDLLVEVTQTSAVYSANDPSNFPIAFNDLPSAHYAVTIIDPTEPRYACSRVVDTVFLPQPTPVTLETVVINQPSCAGATNGSVHVKASGGTPGTDPDYYYSVDGVNYVTPNEAGVAVFTGLGAGNHTFYAVDGHHEDYATPAFLDGDSRAQFCSGSLNFTLDEPDLISVATTMQPVICYGTATGSITVDAVTGGRGGYTYAWEMLDTGMPNLDGYRSFSPADPLHPTDLAHGTYRLTIRDSAGCQAVVVTEVTQPAIALTIDAVQTYAESCTGTADGKIQLFAKGGYPPYTYHIDHQADQVYGLFEGLTAGAYLLTVRDQRGCAVQQLANVIADDLIVEVTDQIPTTVGAENGLIRLHTTGGANKNYYLNGSLSTTGSEFNGLAAGEYTIVIEYNGQCRWEQTYIIDEVDAPPPFCE